MTRRVGRPRVALIIAPHPDDEVIGATGLIRLLVRRGTQVRVAIVTDGAGSHPNSVRWPRRRLVAARRHESRRALRRLGVGVARTHFLGLPDGAADANAISRALTSLVHRIAGLDLVVGPAVDDAHPDHRAAAVAMYALPQRFRRLGYRVWPPGAARGGRRVTLPIASAAKRSLIKLYRTQLGAIRDDPRGFAIARHELDAFAHPLESYRWLR